MTTAAAGRASRPHGRRRRWPFLVAGAAVLLAAWLGVHLTMPAFYARWWYPLEHAAAIRQEAAVNGLEPELVAAVIYRESHFTESAHSDRGAVGLMQVLPGTAEWIHRQPGAPAAAPERLAEAEVNIAYGAWYLHYLTDKYGDPDLALAAYNGGEANLRRWIDDAHRSGRELVIADVPFAETRSFVRSVDETRGTYRRAWGSRL